MTIEDKKEISRLSKLSVVGMEDKKSALALYKRYISVYANFCLTCGSSVRVLMIQIKRLNTQNNG